MWARHLEQILGLWLVTSPWVLGHAGDAPLAVHDVVVGALVVTLSGLAHHPRLRRIHLLLLVLALWLTGLGWWSAPVEIRGYGASQNWLVLGLTLAMLAIVPSRASVPPRSWRGGDGSEDGSEAPERARAQAPRKEAT